MVRTIRHTKGKYQLTTRSGQTQIQIHQQSQPSQTHSTTTRNPPYSPHQIILPSRTLTSTPAVHPLRPTRPRLLIRIPLPPPPNHAFRLGHRQDPARARFHLRFRSSPDPGAETGRVWLHGRGETGCYEWEGGWEGEGERGRGGVMGLCWDSIRCSHFVQ